MRRVISAVRATTSRTHLLRRVSYALHGFLVGLHLALFILQFFPIEKLVTFPLTEDDDPSDISLSVALTMSGTIFATVRIASCASCPPRCLCGAPTGLRRSAHMDHSEACITALVDEQTDADGDAR